MKRLLLIPYFKPKYYFDKRIRVYDVHICCYKMLARKKVLTKIFRKNKNSKNSDSDLEVRVSDDAQF
jgi:hypothetical protein